MHDEMVTRRKWLTDQEFLDLLGATNLIPGPNSTEMAITRVAVVSAAQSYGDGYAAAARGRRRAGASTCAVAVLQLPQDRCGEYGSGYVLLAFLRADLVVPVVQPKDLKKWLRGAGKGETLKTADFRALEQILDAEAAARQK